jgi:hypothetical protein
VSGDWRILHAQSILTLCCRTEGDIGVTARKIKLGERTPVGYATASLTAFAGRALITFLAGFALNIIGSFVNGLIPFRAFVAGFLMTTNFANPGTKKAPVFLSSL